MASPFCWSCLSQLRPAPRALPSSASVTQTAPFHTTAALGMSALMKKKNKNVTPNFRNPTAFRMKKVKQPERTRAPPVEEQRAMAKRIVLSNPNALEVEGMKDLSPETMGDESLRGSILGLPTPMLDQLRAAGAFKPKQGWGIFRRPGTVMRHDALEMGKMMDGVTGDGANKGKAFKKIVTGAKGTGKTVHLAQAMTMALLKGWVVFTVPEAQDLVLGSTSYAPLPDTNPMKYVQPDATVELLSRAAAANGEVLSSLRVSREHRSVGAPAKPGMTLMELAQLGIRNRSTAWGVFQALWAELTATSAAPGHEKHFSPRPPMLVTVDSLAHWMKESAYRTPEFEPIHAHDLAIVNHFVSLLKPGAQQSSLPNGGLLLYALSASNKPSVYAFDVALKQLEARKAGVDRSSPEFPQPDPYRRPDMRVIDALSSPKPKDAKEGALEVQSLGGLTREETQNYMEYFARSGILREKVDALSVSEKWTLAAGGVVGELEKLGKRVRTMA
ncbi:Ribosomal protein [Aspergillus sp. HF37]|nr:Ribosomal protein [Aspergillus sp. HF37]